MEGFVLTGNGWPATSSSPSSSPSLRQLRSRRVTSSFGCSASLAIVPLVALLAGTRNRRGSRHHSRHARPEYQGEGREETSKPVEVKLGLDGKPLPTPKTWAELRSQVGFRGGQEWRTFPMQAGAERPEKQWGLLARTKNLQEVLELLEDHSPEDLEFWTATNLATAWHRLAKYASKTPRRQIAGAGGVQMVEMRLRNTEEKLRSAVNLLGPDAFKEREISNLVYAWGVSHYNKPEMLKGFLKSATKRLADFGAKEIAGMAYGLAKLRCKHEGIFAGLCKVVPDKLPEFGSQEIANLLWSMATVEYSNPEFLEAVCDHASGRLSEFNAQEISNSVWALFRLEHRHRNFLLSACNQLSRRLQELNPQNLANTVYALSQLRFRHKAYIEAMCLHVPTRIKELHKAKEINNITKCLRSLQSEQEPRVERNPWRAPV